MPRKPDLESAYDLSSPEDAKALYADWAESYDSGFVAEHGYVLPEEVARGFHAAGGAGPVLDVGAGTGLVGEALAARHVGPLEGTDISAEMLAVASQKRCYARTFLANITRPIDIADGTYGGVVSAGTFTLGHLGPEPLGELIRITLPGGVLAIAVNEEHWHAAGFGAAFEGFGAAITDLAQTFIPIYAAGAAHAHGGDNALLVTFKKA
ncbi:MAG: class I SAM-dependent methyltransferase [Pseudomonadota bacterium]